MKSRLVLVPFILAATSALADTATADAHSQAAALLSRPQSSTVVTGQSSARYLIVQPASGDAHARAAALLSGVRPSQEAVSSTAVWTPSPQVSVDAHAQAAALLSGQRFSSDRQLVTQQPRSAASTGGQAR
jgi:hypothetical protein